jgi:hypothetical protein
VQRYWISFDTAEEVCPSFVGVTAWDLEDALAIVSRTWMDGRPAPVPLAAIEDVDVRTLPDWVRTTMAPPNWRGIWYPVSSLPTGMT